MLRLFSSLPLLILAAPAMAQTGAAGVDDEELIRPAAANEILVIAERYFGQLEVPHEPIATFDEADIQALGASSVGEMLVAIAPQTGSGRGRGGGFPVVLVNGQRIANFREMRNYPPEAIRRVEVLPEEVALRLGFAADARVVNLILKDNFANRRIEFDHGLPSHGGFAEWEAEGTLLRIAGPDRISVTATAEDRSPLFESERGVFQPADSVPTVPGDPDPAALRSLIADTRSFALNTSLTNGLGKGGLDGSLSLNGNLSRNDSLSFSGLNLVRLAAPDGSSAVRTLPGALAQRSRSTTLQAGAGLNRQLGQWLLSATLDAAHGDNRTLTDRRSDTASLIAAAAAGTLPIAGPLPAPPPAGRDLALSRTDRFEGLATLVGRPLRVPAGAVAATLKGGFTRVGLESSDQGSSAGPVSLRRLRVLAGINLGVPLTSRREGVLGGIGDLTANFSLDWSHLSDFGAVNGWSTGLTWAPTSRLGLQASYIVNQAAPSLSQLGNPQTVTFNVPIYDFTRGETALVAVTSGGNPALRKEEQRDWKFAASWQLPFLPNATLLTEYFRNRSDNVTASFPLLTPEIEAAYPGRATRDAGGRLVALDTRAVTFAEQTATRLRWGLSLSNTIGKAPAGGGRGAIAGGFGGPRSPGAGGPGGGRMMAMLGGGGQGRWSLGLYHTVQLSSRVLVAPGGPALDLLGGDALSTSGTPRHGLELNGGLHLKGKGLFLNGTWSGPTRISASGLPGTSDLRFGSLTKLNLNTFVELGEQGRLGETAPFLKGLRLALRVENLFNSRQRVTDGSGAVPLSYQKDYLDPRGRVIELEVRKMF